MNMDALNEIVFTEEPRLYHYRGKAYRSVTDYLKDALGDPFAGVPENVLKFAQARGNAVHKAVELLTAGELDWRTVDARIEGYVRAAEKFHRDCPGTIVAAELPIVTPIPGVAGRPDLIKFIRGYRSLVDYKTSQQMKPRMRLQTAGYKKIWNARYPKHPVSHRYGLRLQPDGYYKLIPHDDLDDMKAFDDILAQGKATERARNWVIKYA